MNQVTAVNFVCAQQQLFSSLYALSSRAHLITSIKLRRRTEQYLCSYDAIFFFAGPLAMFTTPTRTFSCTPFCAPTPGIPYFGDPRFVGTPKGNGFPWPRTPELLLLVVLVKARRPQLNTILASLVSHMIVSDCNRKQVNKSTSHVHFFKMYIFYIRLLPPTR